MYMCLILFHPAKNLKLSNIVSANVTSLLITILAPDDLSKFCQVLFSCTSEYQHFYFKQSLSSQTLRTVLPVKPNERHFRRLFCYNFASETPTELIFSQLVDFANVTLSNA